MKVSPVARVFAEEWTVLVATLVRDLGDLALAEDVAQEAFVEAAHRWERDGTPDRPGAWLLTVARRRALDRVRRDRRFADRLPALAETSTQPGRPATDLVDDQLALVFGCCHPALATDAQVALTLRHVSGLSTAQIARAFVVPEATMAKRLVRAKAKIRDAGVPFTVPDAERRAERLAGVLAVVYLVFTEGHAASDAADLLRGDLCDEARWLAGLLAELLPDEPEVLGLGALLALTDARRATRVDEHGDLVLLEDQDRSRWDRRLIAEGIVSLQRAFAMGRVGPYQLQAAIAAVHATAPSADATDWSGIVRLYDGLVLLTDSPVVQLNRAAAVAMADGPEAGLALVEELAASGGLAGYRYLASSRADLLRRLGRHTEAADAYREAIAACDNAVERRYLERRLTECTP
ncbi:MAG: sigma-70 family RNA polymerase sigma factor [Actinomycetota bacterium]|nr:sigma-70 family RNA polymerase sigma factor [Actinomycetota bacterium]